MQNECKWFALSWTDLGWGLLMQVKDVIINLMWMLKIRLVVNEHLLLPWQTISDLIFSFMTHGLVFAHLAFIFQFVS